MNFRGAEVEVMDLNSDSREAQRIHAEQLRKVEAQRRARSIVVPTAVEEVKAKLRELLQPATLFGEGPGDRRDRLREVIASLELNDEELRAMQTAFNQSSATSATTSAPGSSAMQVDNSNIKPGHKEVFYSPGSDGLIQFRKLLSPFSFQRAHNRILHTKSIRESEELQAKEDAAVVNQYAICRNIILNSSQFGDDRPCTAVRYSPRGEIFATSSLGGTVKLWDSKELTAYGSMRGQEERITMVAWHPEAFANNSKHGLLASSSADGSCVLWKCVKEDNISNSTTNSNSNSNSSHHQNSSRMDVEQNEGNNNSNSSSSSGSSSSSSSSSAYTSTIVHKYTGHQGCVTSCAVHPMGNILGTSGIDYTYRLWDIETSQESQRLLLLQDGHSKECSALSFQQDGALVATTDYAGVVLCWDLRSGQQVAAFQGHVKKITSVDFNNGNNYQVVTGGMDHTVRIWDLRKKKAAYVLPGHNNVVSDVRYSKSGELLLTSSFDGTAKLWGTRDYRLLTTMTGHVGKVMSADISPADESHVITGGFDRTIKLWAHRDEY